MSALLSADSTVEDIIPSVRSEYYRSLQRGQAEKHGITVCCNSLLCFCDSLTMAQGFSA